VKVYNNFKGKANLLYLLPLFLLVIIFLSSTFQAQPPQIFPLITTPSLPSLPNHLKTQFNATVNISTTEAGVSCHGNVSWFIDGVKIANETINCVCNDLCSTTRGLSAQVLGKDVMVNITPYVTNAQGELWGNSSKNSVEVRLWVNENIALSPGAVYNCTGDADGCVIINASNINLDCQNSLINGTSLLDSRGTNTIYNRDNITIKNCNIFNYEKDGIISQNSTYITIQNSTLKNLRYCASFWGVGNDKTINNYIINTTFENCGLLLWGSDTAIVNLTSINVVSAPSTFTGYGEAKLEYFLKWYLDVNVKDAGGNNLQSVNVNITDKNNNQVFFLPTNNLGNIATQTLTEYFKNRTITIYYSNYTATYSKPCYFPDSQSLNLTTNKKINLQEPSTYKSDFTIAESCVWNYDKGVDVGYSLKISNIGTLAIYSPAIITADKIIIDNGGKLIVNSGGKLNII